MRANHHRITYKGSMLMISAISSMYYWKLGKCKGFYLEKLSKVRIITSHLCMSVYIMKLIEERSPLNYIICLLT